MNIKTRIIRAALAAVLAFSLQPSAFGTLTAIVQPGYQFPTDGSVPLSWDLINLLATPTISIYGTIGGSNTLSSQSVTGGELNPNVLTAGGGLAFDGNMPPGIEIATAGVLTNMLNTNDWAWPLSQPAQAGAVRLNWNPILFSTPTNLFGSGTMPGPLSLNYDAKVFSTNASGLTLASQTNSVPMTDAGGNPFMAFIGTGLTVTTAGGKTNLAVAGVDYRAGVITVDAGGVVTGTFSTAMTNATYALFLTPENNDIASSLYVISKTTTGFTCHCHAAGSVDYLAIPVK